MDDLGGAPLIVIGAGIAGSWLVRVARSRGIAATLVAHPTPPASTAAIGLVRSSHIAEPDRHLLPSSLAAWRTAGVDVRQGARYSRWDRGGYRDDPAWWVVDPTSACLRPDIVGHAEPAGPKAIRVDGRLLTGRVVWCDAAGIGRRTYGVTWLHPDPAAVAYPVAVHMLAPYKILAGTSFATGARVGSSSRTTLGAALADADKMLSLAVRLHLAVQDEGWSPVAGSRLKREVTLTADGPDGAWRWSGFHRTGYGVVPALAGRVLDRVLR